MKHLFIVNPMSGKGKGSQIIMPVLEKALKENDIDGEIFLSHTSAEATAKAKSAGESGEKTRVYACGGDGTIYDVVNGLYGYDNLELAAVPLGSGNDFVRFFGNKEDFLDIDAQINGTPIKIDAMRCGDRIAVNQCSMGFDAEVCSKQASFKKMPVFTGETAYTAALIYCLFRKTSNKFTITVDDGEPMTGKFTFAFGGNCRYYGGGYYAGPYAVPDDGKLDFSIVRAMSVPKLFSRINEYKKGRHYFWEETTYLRGKKMTVHSDTPAAVNIDGECDIVNDSTFEVLENAITFVIPSNCDYIEKRNNGTINDTIGV